LRHIATPNDKTAQQPVHQEIDLTETEIDLDGLGAALAESIQHSRAASVTTDSSEEGSDSDETDAVPTRRNTMASTSTPNPDTKGKEADPPLSSNLTPDQIQQIIGALTGGSGNTKKPKIKEPSTFQGERDQLTGWLAQLSVYFKGVGWEFEYNNDKIVYALSLLRGDALKWATTYIERRQDVTWSRWDDFKNELQGQFGEIDEQGAARAKLMRMSQGSKGATEYWNEYRLIASQTGMDDATLTYHLMRGFKAELQDAWGMDGSDSQDPQFVANWAIKKETKMAAIKHMRHGTTSKEKALPPGTPRNQNGTFRPQNDNQGDPMELDATRRRPGFNISAKEYQRRMRSNLCLKCAKPGHRAAACRSQANSKEGATWEPRNDNKKQWKPQAKAREMEVAKGEESGNDESPQ